ncbi:unnamed protein product [Eruca vesicaria subsp. sativa]|uniref:RRM domain-containing protein n=1 Tax=Eruca vesicaria subsp. sativa TaxID=29727 RepID=A0ABC8L4C1_ERUVS|nr:unnamed protein product [Eruca vesicaria subsp. sativa]
MSLRIAISELFVQAGPVVNVYVPKDRVTGLHLGYGFIEFCSEEDADYAIKILNMIKIHGKPMCVNKASQDKKSLDVGANLFIGNLDPDVDEKILYDTFSAFGGIASNPKIMRDPDTGNSRGFGFISYDSIDASDAAIEAMTGQYLCISSNNGLLRIQERHQRRAPWYSSREAFGCHKSNCPEKQTTYSICKRPTNCSSS